MDINKEFHRDIQGRLEGFIGEKRLHQNVLILSGARQVGKTTLLQEVLKNKNHLYINLEKTPSNAEEIDGCVDFSQFEKFLKEKHNFDHTKQILCIDEAQQSRGLGRFVTGMKEDWEYSTVVLTGSLINELHNETPRRPVGRETFLNMWPMTFKEFVKARGYDSLVETMETFQLDQEISSFEHNHFLEAFDLYLNVGGLPEIVST